MKRFHKKYLPLVVAGVLFLAFYSLKTKIPEEIIRQTIKSAGPFGIVLFIFFTWLTYVVAPLSGTPFLFAGFYLFGETVVLYSFIAASIASITNYWIARIWGRPIVQKLAGKESLKKIDSLTKNYGIQTLLLFRIFLGSFNDVISYAFGLTQMKFTPYLFISISGMIPGTVIWYFLSSKINNALIFTVLSVIIAYVSLMIYVLWKKRKKLIKKDDFSFKYFSKVDVSPELLYKMSELLESCFTQKNKTLEEKAEHNDKYCSKKDRIGFSLAIKGNRVIGAAITLKRKILYRGEQIILGGIGGVCTNEEFRRKGIVTNLLKIAIEKLKEEKCDIAYLCIDTEKLAKLYEPFGFKKLKKQYTYLGKSGKRYFEWGGMLAPINSPSLFQQVMKDKKCFDIGTGNW